MRAGRHGWRGMVLRVAAACAAAGLAASGCGTMSGGRMRVGSTLDLNGYNVAAVARDGSMTYAIEKNITAWNLLTAEGYTFDTGEALQQQWPSPFISNPDLSVTMNTDLLESAQLVSDSPETVVYRIQPDARWSDGVPISADDFSYAWRMQNGLNPAIDVISTTGYQDIASVTGSAGGKTVTVVFARPFSDWRALFSYLYPAHWARSLGADPVAVWNTVMQQRPPLHISGGPYVMTAAASDGSSVTLQPNPNWYGARGPHLRRVVFRAITDATQEVPALANHEVQAIYPQPELDLLDSLRSVPGVSEQLVPGLEYEHIDFNLANTFLGQNPAGNALRTAMFTATDRTAIIDRTVGQFDADVSPLNSRMFVPGQRGYQDNSEGLGDGDVAAAKRILVQAGYTGVGGELTAPGGQAVPAFLMRYTVGNAIRQSEAQEFARQMRQLGISITVQSTDSLGSTLTQADANHKYDIIVFAWVASPFPASQNQPLFTTAAPGSPQENYGYYSNRQVDAWLADAVGDTDPQRVIDDLNNADQQISRDAYTLPLYQKPTLLVYDDTFGNIRNNPTESGPPYNIQDWGVKTGAAAR